MSNSLVKRGLQLVKSGFTEQAEGTKKAEVSGNLKGTKRGRSEQVEQNGHSSKSRRSLDGQKGKIL